MDDRMSESPPVENWVEKVIESIHQISHGSVEIVVQDSKVIQINKVEKIRLTRESCKNNNGKSGVPTPSKRYRNV